MPNTSDPMDKFRPVMPSFIRLLAGVIVLVVVQSVVLGFQGINQTIPNSTITIASVAIFAIGLVVAFVVLKFGTQLANAFSEAYRAYRTYTPILAYIFQIIALWIVYEVGKAVSSPLFASTPWAYGLIFLVLALFPTIKVVMNLVQALEGHPSPKHNPSREEI